MENGWRRLQPFSINMLLRVVYLRRSWEWFWRTLDRHISSWVRLCRWDQIFCRSDTAMNWWSYARMWHLCPLTRWWMWSRMPLVVRGRRSSSQLKKSLLVQLLLHRFIVRFWRAENRLWSRSSAKVFTGPWPEISDWCIRLCVYCHRWVSKRWWIWILFLMNCGRSHRRKWISLQRQQI